MLNTPNTLTRSTWLLSAVLLASLVLAAAPKQAHAAYDILVSLGTVVPMTSTKKGYEKYGQCSTMSFGAAHSIVFGGGSSPEFTQPNLTEINLTRLLDSASSKLWHTSIQGTVIPTVKIALLDSMGKKIVEIELGDVYVTSYNVSANTGGDNVPFESFSLAFRTIKYTTSSFDSAGKATTTTGAWDLVQPL